MGVTTYYNFPYPEPSEPVRNGAANIKALAEAIANRLFLAIGGFRVESRHVVATFGVNGDAVIPYTASFPTGKVPNTVAIASNSTATNDSGIVLTMFQPQYWEQQFTVLARYAKDGRLFTGNLDIYYVAVGAAT